MAPLLDPRQVIQVDGREVLLPACVCRFDVGHDGFELTDEEEWWMLSGSEYQQPPVHESSLLLFLHGKGLKREYGFYEDLLARFEKLRGKDGMLALILIQDGYTEREYNNQSQPQWTIVYDARQRQLTVEVAGQVFLRPWNPPPRRAPGYQPVKMPDPRQVTTMTM